MSSWLSNRLGIHLNLRPLAAPAGALLGGMFGGNAGAAIGAGIAKTADNKLHGDSWGHSLGQGALAGGITALGGAGLDKLRSVFAGGGSAAPFTPSSSVASGGYTSAAGGGWVPYGEQAVENGGHSILDAIGHGATNVGKFVGAHPQATAMGLQGIGQIGQMGSENAYRKAQTHALDLNNDQNQYELETKKRRDAALAPLIAAFQGRAQDWASHPATIAPNPYLR